MKKEKVLKEVRDYAILIVVAVVLAFLMNRFVYANAEVPSGSMIPAVIPGDRLIVNRLSYAFSDPERGDIVMFKFLDYDPDGQEEAIDWDEADDYLKRIIGLPGETVEIKGGLVYINGSDKPLSEPYINDAPNGDYGPFIVPENSYLMLGDNRDISDDSRFWRNKFVKKEKIVGKAFLRYYPRINLIRSADYAEE